MRSDLAFNTALADIEEEFRIQNEQIQESRRRLEVLTPLLIPLIYRLDLFVVWLLIRLLLYMYFYM